MGANAWADVIYSQDYEADGATADWTTGTSGRFTPVILEDNGNHFLSVEQGTRNNNGTTISSTSLSGKVAAGTDFTMTFDLKISSSTNQSPASFNIYDASNANVMFSLTATGTWATTWKINGSDTQVNLANTNKGNSSNSISDVPWYSIKVTRSGTYTYVTIAGANGNEVFERSAVTSPSSTGGLGKMEFVTRRYMANFAIDNIVIREIEDGDLPTTATYEVTTKYQLSDGTAVLEDRIDYITEGESFESAYETSFDDDTYRYTYVSGAESIASVEENATVTIVYSREALADHTVTFNAIGDFEKQLSSVVVKDAKSYTYAYPRYLSSGTNLYQIVKNRYDQGFQYTASNVTDDVNANETYKKVANSVVAFCSEAEDIEGMTVSSTNNNIPVRCSKGNAAYASSDVDIVTLPAGKYIFKVATFGNAGTDFNFKVNEKNIFTASTMGYEYEAVSEEITLEEESTVVLAATGNGGSSPKVIDYICIIRTDVVYTSITSAGYATFSSNKTVDFSKVEGIKAYLVTSRTGYSLTLVPRNVVPANNGVVIEGTAGDYMIPVVENNGEEYTDTNLESVSEDMPAPNGSYVLQNQNGKVGFYRVDTSIATPKIPAGRAYLPADYGDAKERAFFFNGDATAIETVEAPADEDIVAIYSASGVEVKSLQKGLNIVVTADGKTSKVFVK